MAAPATRGRSGSRTIRTGTRQAAPVAGHRRPRAGRGIVMYQWIVFLHIASVLGLLLVHPVTIAFHLKQEREHTRIRELLEVSAAASALRWIFFGLVIASGVALGVIGSF